LNPPTERFERLDLHLVRMRLARSRRDARDLIASGNVLLNGRRARKGAAVGSDDRVELIAERTASSILPNPNIDVPVLYQDEDIIIVNKPGLVPCHPLRSDERDTLMNAVVARFPETAGIGGKPLEGGLVHRLDNGTSGALLISRNPQSFARMRSAIRSGEVNRTYHALVAGIVAAPLEISRPIAHSRKNARKMVAFDQHEHRRVHVRGALSATTSISPLERLGEYTLAMVIPQTGRRHQIRVHLAGQGLPIVGDLLYGGPEAPELPQGRFWLHLARVEFNSPSGTHVIVDAPRPSDLEAVLNRLRAQHRCD
jgi:23S rRNA pseudouridine1911/1915/1917 synthase